jgi:hypothetical protein
MVILPLKVLKLSNRGSFPIGGARQFSALWHLLKGFLFFELFFRKRRILKRYEVL